MRPNQYKRAREILKPSSYTLDFLEVLDMSTKLSFLRQYKICYT